MSEEKDIHSNIIKILSEPPIDYFDREDNNVKESQYQLIEPRVYNKLGVDFSSREIGSVNMLIAAQYFFSSIDVNLKEEDERICATKWADAICQLEDDKFIRKIPEKVRQTFKVI